MLGFIILVVIIVVVIVALIATGVIRFGGRRIPRRVERIEYFYVNPSNVCPTQSCLINVRYNVDTNQKDTKTELKFIRPSGDEIILSNELSFNKNYSGTDELFKEGAGIYQFQLKITGEIVGEQILTLSVTIVGYSGITLRHSVNTTASTDVSEYQRQSVSNETGVFSSIVTDTKLPITHTICTKYLVLKEITYVRGSVSGWPGFSGELGITIMNNARVPISTFNLKPGQTFTFQNPIGQEFILGSVMPTGFNAPSPSFPIGVIITWDLDLKFNCI